MLGELLFENQEPVALQYVKEIPRQGRDANLLIKRRIKSGMTP